MQNDAKYRKSVSTLKIWIVILLVIVLLFGGITGLSRIIYPRVCYSHIAFKNSMAYHAADAVSQNLEMLHVPQKGTVLLTGECVLHSYLLVYANDWLEEDMLLYGDEVRENQSDWGCWTVKITDGKTAGAWFAEHPLTEAELHPYTEYMQYGQCRFATPFISLRFWERGTVDDTALIGYYAPKHTEATQGE